MIESKKNKGQFTHFLFESNKLKVRNYNPAILGTLEAAWRQNQGKTKNTNLLTFKQNPRPNRRFPVVQIVENLSKIFMAPQTSPFL